jgi:DNA-binding CsgD family transcriptional regulator
MVELTAQDTQRLHQSIQSLYSLKSLDNFGLETLAILEQIVPTHASIVLNHTMNLSSPTNMSSPMIQSCDQDFQQLLLSDAILPLLATAVLTGAHKFSDFVSHQDVYEIEGITDVLAAVESDDHMVMNLYSEAATTFNARSPVAYYYFYRQWGTWTERDRLILNLLQPHLIQAYQIANSFQQQQQQFVQFQQSIDQSGMIVLDRTGAVQWMTAQAEQWLCQYFSHFHSLTQLPETLQSWLNHQTACLNTTGDVPSAFLPLRIQQQDCQLVIRLTIEPAAEQYILLLAEEKTLSLLATLQLLGLSQREAEVLFGVIQGQDTKAIAHHLQINSSTVRKHLENIYRKLNVQSRTEAISQVLQHLGILNSPPII